ncbi:MAG: Xaa-Pro peptidase family protein [Firmicutes bacterium]|nr:Xaa-Pro peptidase family protein [Bacillota bacterium]MCL5994355.1 Xaa-Pro peptidase family protein [Bacillota bacterium]
MIPKEELRRRKDVLQEKLRSLELDGALLAQNMSLYYYTGTLQCQYAYIPAEGEVYGQIRKNMVRGKQEAGVALLALSSFSGLSGLLAEVGYLPKRLGLELDVLPAATYFRLREAFFGVELTDLSSTVREARQVKSAYEFEQLLQAAKQVDLLHARLPALLHEGKEELEIAADCEAVLRKLGHQGFTRMRGFKQEMFFGHLLSGQAGAVASHLDSPTGGIGVSVAASQGAGRKLIRRGEPVTLDYCGVYHGYGVDQTRLYSIGSLDRQLSLAFEAALAVQEAVSALLKPGVTGGEIYLEALRIAKKFALAEHFMGVGDTQAKYVGHGVGLEFDEFPILAKGSQHLLAENMVVAVEPKFTFPNKGVVGIENTWQVLKDGPRKICITADTHVVL